MSALFDTPHGALAFAFRYQTEQFPLSVLGRLQGGTLGSGKGLVGMDAAGQAGLILSCVETMQDDYGFELRAPLAQQAYMVARYAPHSVGCKCSATCCSGHKPARLWESAVDWIADQSIGQLSGCMSNRRLRLGIVRRFFNEHVLAKIGTEIATTLAELAAMARVNRDTASEHNSRIVTWLRKEEKLAQLAVDHRLRTKGVCE